MSYCWEQNETLDDALRRIAADQVDMAIAEIEDDQCSPHEAVHRLRQHCKKIRALIRLVRPAFSDYSTENAIFREVARPLSGVRDAQAMRSTLDTIRKPYGDELPAACCREFEVLQAWLDLRMESLGAAMKAEAALEKACEAFAASKSRIQSWSLDDVDVTAVTAGLRKTYKRGRKAMDAAAILPAPEYFHEWRKRVKYHCYHLDLLRRAWPPVTSAARKAARDLSDWLGDYHDVAVFRQVLGEHADEVGSPSRYPALLAVLSRRGEELQSAAFSLGRRVYAETSQAHADRMQATIAAWRSEALATRP